MNIASRLEGLSKEFKSDIIISSELLRKTDLKVKTGKRKSIKVKGKNKEIEVIEFFGFLEEKRGERRYEA